LGRLRDTLAGIYELEGAKSRLLSMEGYRGLAILLVFLVHFDDHFKDYLDVGSTSRILFDQFGRVGNVGVDLFFVASGYLIYGAVIRKPVNYWTFMKRRVERIYPVFTVVFILYVILTYAVRRDKAPTGTGLEIFGYYLYNFFLGPGMLPESIFGNANLITPAWSLSYEFFYYLTIPLLVSATGMRAWKPKTRIAFFVLLTVAFLAFCFTVYPLRDRLAMFLSGILLYETMHNTTIPSRLTKPMEWGVIALFVISFPIVVLLKFRHPILAGLPGMEFAMGTYQVIVMFITYYLFALFCYDFDGIIKRVMCWAPLRWYGNMSYSYYLMHGATVLACSAVFHKVFPQKGHQPWLVLTAAIVTLLATIVSSTVIFYFVEKPYSLQPKRKTAPAAREPLATAEVKG
jgi:peptidoglycan/LPS O-acetylase OafA/YrhL